MDFGREWFSFGMRLYQRPYRHTLVGVIRMSQMHIEEVRFVGLDKLRLDSFTTQEIERTAVRHAAHLRERAGDVIDVTVRLKAHKMSDGTERYAAMVEMSYGGGWLSGIADDAYLATALKRAFLKIEHQLEDSTLL